jgi:hypothetical protein
MKQIDLKFRLQYLYLIIEEIVCVGLISREWANTDTNKIYSGSFYFYIISLVLMFVVSIQVSYRMNNLSKVLDTAILDNDNVNNDIS